MPIYAEVSEKYPVEYIAGGATQNSIRVAQWMLQEPQATAFIGCVGADEYGATLKGAAEAGGTTVCYQETTDGTPTGTCAVLITGDNRSLVANISAASKYELTHLQSAGMPHVEKAKFFYISGFFITSSPPSIMEVAKHSAANDKVFMMNLAAPFICQFFKDPLVEALNYCDYVFGNESEYTQLSDSMGWGTTDLKEIALKVAAMPKANGTRARVAICTHGAEPTIIATAGSVTEYPIAACTKDEIIDTNGAGDAWVGGFIAGLVKGKSIDECTRAGAYAAKVVIGRSGCTYPPTPAYLL
jgi:adenosine kinase